MELMSRWLVSNAHTPHEGMLPCTHAIPNARHVLAPSFSSSDGSNLGSRLFPPLPLSRDHLKLPVAQWPMEESPGQPMHQGHP